MGTLERLNRENAVKGGSLSGEKPSEFCARVVQRRTVRDADTHVESSEAAMPSVGEVILRSVRPEFEEGTVWDLSVAGIENALDVTLGKKEFPEAVACIGNRAFSSGASGTTVNSAMAFAAETLVLAGYNGAARLMPLIGQGIIAYLLIKTIVPDIMSLGTEEARNTASSQEFTPAEGF